MTMLKSTLIFLALLLALYLGYALKPNYVTSQQNEAVDLEQIIPLEFADWKVDNTLPIILGNPEQEELLGALYSQLLSRTYVDSKGNRLMLSIAYGDVQNKSYQVHFPEVCYPAQGFELLAQREKEINVSGVRIPVKEIDTKQGKRNEFVTYWVRVGDDLVISRFDQKIKTIMYGLEGRVVDGLLFRVSTINLGNDYELHREFVERLLNGLSMSDRTFLIGKRL